MSEQVNLPFGLRERCALDAFYAGPNTELMELVRRFAAGRESGVLFLHGPTGCGKSHLLQGAARTALEGGRLGAYVALAESGVRSGLVAQLNPSGLLCLDGVEAIAGNPAFEAAILELYERVQQGSGAILAAATVAPGGISGLLPDLVSRLSSRYVYRIAALDDRHRADALGWAARRRGIELSAGVVEWLLRRVPRESGALFRLLDEIDAASLTENRRVTIPFLRSLGIG